MQTFLDEVAEAIFSSPYELSRVKVILPSIRATTFLYEALKKVIDQPVIAPRLVNIESFISELSGLERMPTSEVLFHFYEVYQQITPEEERESLTQFMSWAPGLINEFNEIDAHAVDSKSIFEFLVNLKNIEHWGTAESSSASQKHLAFTKRLRKYHQHLYAHLLEQQKGYQGMQLREALQNIEFYTAATTQHHFFVGFNALNKTEENIIQELMAAERAIVLWDIDHAYFADPQHTAGHFIRGYFNQWNVLKNSSKPSFPKHFEKDKEIEIIGVPKNIAQAKTAAERLTSYSKENPNTKSVIVLGDEQLLIPTISGVATSQNDWNVTMGYPVKESNAAAFFQSFLKFHIKYPTVDQIDFPALEAVLSLSFCKEIFEGQQHPIKKEMAHYKNQKTFYLSRSEVIKQSSVATLFFAVPEPTQQFVERLSQICTLFITYHEAQNNDTTLEIYFYKAILAVIHKMRDWTRRFPFFKHISDVALLFDTLLKEQRVDFSGSALSSCQIMGLLETRLLDFDNVIITNVNEGILPGGKQTATSIPFDVRRKFGLPTFLEKDHLFAYHFFRILQRAKKITLIYNNSLEGLNAAEKSRFLHWLTFFSPPNHKISYPSLSLPSPNVQNSLKTVAKTEEVMEALKRLSEKGFSPSSLLQYIRNPYQFYVERLLHIKPVKAVEQSLSALDKGTLMHAVLEKLYLPYTDKFLKTEDFDQMLSLLETTLEEGYDEIYGKGHQRKGKNFILYKILLEILENFIKKERQSVLEGNEIKILGLEITFEKQLNFPNLNFPIQLQGTVDRIDLFNNQFRIIDYKTGAVNKADLAMDDWDVLQNDPKKSALFQVLIYAYALNDRFDSTHGIMGVVPLRTLDNSFLPASFKKTKRSSEPLLISENLLQNIENQLHKLITEIFDASIPFTEKP